MHFAPHHKGACQTSQLTWPHMAQVSLSLHDLFKDQRLHHSSGRLLHSTPVSSDLLLSNHCEHSVSILDIQYCSGQLSMGLNLTLIQSARLSDKAKARPHCSGLLDLLGCPVGARSGLSYLLQARDCGEESTKTQSHVTTESSSLVGFSEPS